MLLFFQLLFLCLLIENIRLSEIEMGHFLQNEVPMALTIK